MIHAMPMEIVYAKIALLMVQSVINVWQPISGFPIVNVGTFLTYVMHSISR